MAALLLLIAKAAAGLLTKQHGQPCTTVLPHMILMLRVVPLLRRC
jgi:hypothetical protein